MMTIDELIRGLQELKRKGYSGRHLVCVYPYPKHTDQCCYINEITRLDDDKRPMLMPVIELGDPYDPQHGPFEKGR